LVWERESHGLGRRPMDLERKFGKKDIDLEREVIDLEKMIGKSNQLI